MIKRILAIIFACLVMVSVQAQSDGQWGTCEFASVSDMNAFDPSTENWNCKKAFIQATNEHYQWDGSEWVEVKIQIASKVFYPPAIAIDVSTTGTGRTLDLHQTYVNLYGSPAIKSSSAPSSIPTYQQDELYYYVTDYDNTVFSNISIDANGLMTYNVIATPSDNCSVLNVVFVVK